jgi:hypothetical protein
MFGNPNELDLTQPIKGGSYEDIEYDHPKKDTIRVYIPPVPKKQFIQNYDLPKKQQKFKRQGYPDWWEEEYEKEMEERETNDLYRSAKCEQFRVECWEKREKGHWVYINGSPVYLPGKYWYYLEWCENDNGYPDYRNVTRKKFLFTTYCFQLETCLATFEIGPRGFGKTTEVVSVTLEHLTKTPGRRHGAIQSKTEGDAKNVIFDQKMVPVYMSLPEFFQPISNHGTKPEKKLSFFRDTTRGKKAKKVKVDKEAELKNTIYYVAAKETTLDGGTYAIIICDEAGKTDPAKEADVHRRWYINKHCVYRNNEKRGMMLGTSTVEDLKKGGAQAKAIWNESDPKKLNDNGYTISGGYRFFVSALDVRCFDEFGDSDRVKALKLLDAERKALKDKPNDLQAYIRKFPYTSEEAFMEDGEHCEFNAFVLNHRIEELELHEPVVTGNLDWINEPDGALNFNYDPNGRFQFSEFFKTFDQANMVGEGSLLVLANGKQIRTYRPLNDLKYRIGTDPVDHGVETVDARVSDSAAYCWRLFDGSIDREESVFTLQDCNGNDLDYKIGKIKWQTHMPVVQYVYRNDDPTVYYEDMIKLCRFFGCSILAENQKVGIINHFRNRGYGDFLMYRPAETFTIDTGKQNTVGVPGSTPLVQQWLGLTKSYVNNHGHRIPFLFLCRDLLRFRKSNIRLHDATVAFGTTQIALLGEAKQVPQLIEVKELFKKYKPSGNTVTLSN